MWIRDQLEEKGISQAELGGAIGLTSVQVNKILTGYRRLYADEAEKIATFLGSRPPPKSHRGADGNLAENGSSLVPVYDVMASAGHGSYNGYEAIAYSLAFPPAYLQKLTRSNPKNLAIISVKGDSMNPTLMDDDVVMIDTSKKSTDFDGLFVFRFGEALHVKRVTRAAKPGRILALSDNRTLYDPIEYDAADVEVIGRVIWYGRKV